MEIRVFGPPGTGKTTWLARQVSLAVEKRGPDEVLVASFTRAAAQELAGRGLPIGEHRIGTLHALCYREIGRPEIAERHIAEFNKWQSVYELSGDSADVEDAIEQRFAGRDDALMNQVQVLRAQMVPVERWPVHAAALWKSWSAWKYENDYVDFTDMIEIGVNEFPGVPHSASVGFFDEVQDFTPLELALVRKWSSQMDMAILAGDDDQCLYSFKGSSPDAFLNPPLPDDQKRVLRQSWRMPRAVHAYSDAWVRQLAVREPKDFAPRDEEGAVVHAPHLTYRNPMALLEDARQHLDRGKTVMFLSACSYHLDYLVGEMRKDGEVFHNPYRRKRGDWNPLHSARGVSTAERVLAFLSDRRDVMGDRAHPWTGKDLRLWSALVKKSEVFNPGADGIVQAIEEDRPATLDELDRLFRPGMRERAMLQGTAFLSTHALASRAKSLDYPLRVIKRHGAGKLLAKPKVIVGTIHSVKGGQADVVYLMPDLSPGGWTELQGAGRDSIIRQFYVGMSRARETLIICGASSEVAVRLP